MGMTSVTNHLLYDSLDDPPSSIDMSHMSIALRKCPFEQWRKNPCWLMMSSGITPQSQGRWVARHRTGQRVRRPEGPDLIETWDVIKP